MLLTVEKGAMDPGTLRFAEERGDDRIVMPLVLNEGQRRQLNSLLATEEGRDLLLEVARGGMRLQSLTFLRSFSRP